MITHAVKTNLKHKSTNPIIHGRFDHMAHARNWCEEYFAWYNFKHHHSGLTGFTPEQSLYRAPPRSRQAKATSA